MSEHSTIDVSGSSLGSELTDLLLCDEMAPGSDISYQTAKTIYMFHPLGGKMVDKPIDMSMSQSREITVPGSPEQRIKEAFQKEWNTLRIDEIIKNVKRTSRIYGIASVILGSKGVPASRAIKPQDLAGLDIFFNVLDPLNTAGSLVMNQDPNSAEFQRQAEISVSGETYHRSRSCVIMNEAPIYIGYSNSAFGYVGRSVYQRALFPLKSFVQSMITDDMVTRKAGLLVAMMKGAGSIADKISSAFAGIKRNLLKEAKTNNVISIGVDESVETLDMKNADTAMTTARKNILENVASASSMPAKLLNSESFAEGFGEGSEDAKDVVRYINGIRAEMQPLFDFFDPIVMWRAWNPEFYKTIQKDFPEYAEVGYLAAFYQWKNAFTATWPNLLEEPESEKAKTDDVKLKAIVAMIEVLMPQMDPDNKSKVIEWACQNFNECENLLKHPLHLDFEALAAYVPPVPAAEPGAPDPFSAES